MPLAFPRAALPCIFASVAVGTIGLACVPAATNPYAPAFTNASAAFSHALACERTASSPSAPARPPHAHDPPHALLGP
eukprot:14444199-Alexandrium_andersonii.AAC.1